MATLKCVGSWGAEPGVVEFPDGRRVRGAAVRRARSDLAPPEFAVYLLGRRPAAPAWPFVWVRWRDFGLPQSEESALAALMEAFERASQERVELACAGGVGRTGTALAVLAVLSGVAPEAAVGWVRANYRSRAVETSAQRRWVEKVGQRLRAS